MCTKSDVVLLFCVFFLLMALRKNVPCVSQLLLRSSRNLDPTFIGSSHTAEVRSVEACLGQVRLTGHVEGAAHHIVSPPKPTVLLASHLAELVGAFLATRKPLWWGRISLSFSFYNGKLPHL